MKTSASREVQKYGPSRLLGLVFYAVQGKLYYGQILKTYLRRFCLKMVKKLYGQDLPRFELVQKLYDKDIPNELPSSLTFNGYYPRSTVPSIDKQFELLVDEFANAIQEICPKGLEANVSLQKSLTASSPAERTRFAEQAIEADPGHPDLYFNLATLYHSITGRLEGPYADYTVKGLHAMSMRHEQLESQNFAINGRILNHKWTEMIGHIGWLDLFIKAHKLKLLPEHHYSLVTTSSSVANARFLSLFDEHIPITMYSPGLYWLMHNRFFSSCSERIEVWSLKSGCVTVDSATDVVQKLWKEQKREPLVQIKPKDKKKGIQTLADLGVPKGGWFVALHIREEANSFSRNSDVSSYVLAIQAIIESGGYVIRMGHLGMQVLPFDHPCFIDYANSAFKSESMDVFLWSECRFFLGTSSGPMHAVFAFATPALWTNAVSLGRTSSDYYNTLLLPKLWFSTSQNRYLSFSETLENQATYGEATHLAPDLVLKDNSADEIRDATIEMIELTKNPRARNDYDLVKDNQNLLQQQLDSIRQENNLAGRLPLSRAFLQRHAALLK